jgi:DNA polymerase-3 subunit epsilon
MTGGQATLTLDSSSGMQSHSAGGAARIGSRPVGLRVIRATEEELAAHERSLDSIGKASGGAPVWRR